MQVLKAKGVIRVKSVSHHRVGEAQPPHEAYTIEDHVPITVFQAPGLSDQAG